MSKTPNAHAPVEAQCVLCGATKRVSMERFARHFNRGGYSVCGTCHKRQLEHIATDWAYRTSATARAHFGHHVY